jgi:hypothetical protein
MTRLILSFAAALVLASTACAAPAVDDATLESTEDGPVDGTTSEAQSAMTSQGFICSTDRCICKMGSSDPVDSCDGMWQMCGRVGSAYVCDPFDGWCYCFFQTASAGFETSDPPPPPPRRAPVSATTTATRAF